jgi:hypothetical protein
LPISTNYVIIKKSGVTMHYQKELIFFIKNKKEEQGVISTNIPALRFYITNEPSEFTSIIYEPSICIALQGEKAVGFGLTSEK